MNNEQNMTQNSNQTTQAAAEQTAAEQAAVEQKLAKKKLTRRIFIGGGRGPGERLGIRLRHRKP